jgi:1-deoxy-D-xylulose-5-phosphate synthase
MSDRPDTPLLDQIQFPSDIRKLQKDQLPELADELRADLISSVSQSC